MSRTTLRLGIIGGGLMGRLVAAASRRLGEMVDLQARLEVAAVASRTPASLDHFAREHPSAARSTDPRAVLDDPAIDAVYIAVPHDLHETLYTQAIRAGKHLLGEKPFGIDADANARIAAVAPRHGRVVRCCSEFPYFPGAQRIAADLRDGRFGRVISIEAGFLHCSDLDPLKPINWKRQAASNGAYGCMGDLGMHVLHLPLRAGVRVHDVRAILDKIVDHRPDASGRPTPCDTPDNATLLCRASLGGDRFPMTLRTARIAPGETNTWYLRVEGTQRAARFSTRRPRTLQTLRFVRGEPQAWAEEALGHQSVYRTVTGAIFEFGFNDALLQMTAAFTDEAAGGAPAYPCASVAETQACHAVLTAALRSDASNQVVPIEGGGA